MRQLPPSSKNFIFFDFDGVIADSFALAFEIEKTLCPRMTEADYRRRFEGNINDWDKVTYGHSDECRHDIDFFADYLPRMKKEVGVIPGMREVIEGVSKLCPLIIISSTLTSPIQEFMDKHSLSAYFAEIMGNDVHTSKSEKINMVFVKYKIAPQNCVFITDTLGDMREAEHAGVEAIGVSWGFNDQETLSQGHPFRIIDTPNDIPTAVSDYFFTKFSARIKKYRV